VHFEESKLELELPHDFDIEIAKHEKGMIYSTAVSIRRA
jgi:hypothetical protein